MNHTFQRALHALIACLLTSCNGQNKPAAPGVHTYNPAERVGGPCEAGYCDLMYLGMPEYIPAVDTSAGWYEPGQKLIVTGTAFQTDGKTPAPGVVLYYHHTDNEGYYSPRNDKPENQTRHGHLRGWMKTDANGRYTLYTVRPAPYPDTDLPAHIHWLIKEPDVKNEYWPDDLMFEDDNLLLPYIRQHEPENRCGSGVARISLQDRVQIAQHDFILGLNIPNYPSK